MYTLAYNTEDWIYPFLKITEGLDKRIILQGKKPLPEYTEHHATQPDRSEALIRTCFPDVEVIYQKSTRGAEVYEQGLDLLRDYDFVLRFDSDEIFMPEDWKKIVTLIRNGDITTLKYDFSNCIVYANKRDFDHGVKFDAPWVETRGMNPKKNWSYQEHETNPGLLLRDMTMHHFSAWKGKGITGWTQSEKELLEKYGNNGDWYHTPQVLRDLFEEGWKILQTLEYERLKK